MSGMPLVSILIPTYNMAEFIEEAVDSALHQTYQNCEIIIVDNCSTDNTLEKLGKYKAYPHIFIYKNDSNVGMVQNWNTCLLYAKGDYIKFLNADDVLEKSIISTYLEVFKSYSNVSLISSAYTTFGGYEKTYMPPIGVGLINGKDAITQSIQSYNWLGSPTQVMFRKEHLSVGYFNIASNWWSDWELWLKILLKGDLYVIDKSLTKYRVHGGQITRDFDNGKSDIEILHFFQGLQHSLPFNFCKQLLAEIIKEKKYKLYISGIDNIRRKNIQLGEMMLEESGNNKVSPMLLKYIYEKFRKRI